MKLYLFLICSVVFHLLSPLHAADASVGSDKASSSKDTKRAPNPALVSVEDIPGLPRVMLIGDSISIGYTLPTRKLLEGKANVHRPAANCSSTGIGLTNLDRWLGDKKWDVIHFNFGLHDAKLPPEGIRYASPEDYEKNLRELVKRLKATGAKLIFATTTPVPNGGVVEPTRRFGSIEQYNSVALKIMIEQNIMIDDLNAAITPHLAEAQKPNDVHFNDDGSLILAKSVAASISNAIATK